MCNRIIWISVGNTALEAYPTSVRGSAYGLGQIVVRLCAFTIPTFVVPPLDKDGSGKSVTFSVIAIFFAAGLIGAILLPVETAGRPMADVAPLQKQEHKSSEEKENLGKP